MHICNELAAFHRCRMSVHPYTLCVRVCVCVSVRLSESSNANISITGHLIDSIFDFRVGFSGPPDQMARRHLGFYQTGILPSWKISDANISALYWRMHTVLDDLAFYKPSSFLVTRKTSTEFSDLSN